MIEVNASMVIDASSKPRVRACSGWVITLLILANIIGVIGIAFMGVMFVSDGDD